MRIMLVGDNISIHVERWLNAREKFLDNRFKKFGHTGYCDQLVYMYDQPIRLKAVFRELTSSGIKVDTKLRVLDVGRGTGDFILKFAKEGLIADSIEVLG